MKLSLLVSAFTIMLVLLGTTQIASALYGYSHAAPLVAWSNTNVFDGHNHGDVRSVAEKRISLSKSPLAIVEDLAAYLNTESGFVPKLIIVYITNTVSSHHFASVSGLHSNHKGSKLFKLVSESKSSVALSFATKYGEHLANALEKIVTGQVVEISSNELTDDTLPFEPSKGNLIDLVIVRFDQDDSLTFEAAEVSMVRINSILSSAVGGDYVAFATSRAARSSPVVRSFDSEYFIYSNPSNSSGYNPADPFTWTGFTVPILMGLFVSGIMVVILFVGVAALFTTQVQTRFDDAKVSKGLPMVK